jgi:lipopolysaccharide/colanic/teichoic acid biosynthesis glycosyltransferase
VKPGISGWAQVNQGHVAEVDEVNRKLQYDFYYIKYFSPWLDLLILFRTIKTVLTGFGSPTDLGGAYLTGRSNGQQEEQPGRV